MKKTACDELPSGLAHACEELPVTQIACESTMVETFWNFSKKDEFCIKNEELFIKNKGFCLEK